MTEAATTSPTAQSAGRKKMLILMGLYAAPLLAAWLWLGYVKQNEGVGVSVNGELIVPAVPLTDVLTVHSGGQAWSVENFRKQWTLVYFDDGGCDSLCEKNLYHMRQVRLRTGRHVDRVQRVLVTPEVEGMAVKLAQASEGLHVIGGSSAQIESLRGQFAKAQSGMGTCDHCIYVIDPLGNLMMRFPHDLDPGKMYKDLKHLLKVSRIG